MTEVSAGERSADGENLERDRSPAVVKAGYVASALYILFILLFVGWLVTLNQPGGLFERPASLSIGTIADFLAGVFAPLAFLWLFVAVRVQSHELALQRRELKLTRREFHESREVMKLQADESRKQAELMSAQTTLLTEQHKWRDQERNDARSKTLVKALVEWAIDNLEEWETFPNGATRRTIFDEPSLIDNDRAFRRLLGHVIQKAKRQVQQEQLGVAADFPIGAGHLEFVEVMLQAIKDLEGSVTPVLRTYLITVRLDQALAAVKQMLADQKKAAIVSAQVPSDRDIERAGEK